MPYSGSDEISGPVKEPAFEEVKRLHGEQTLAELASHYSVHTNQISKWKKQLQAGSQDIFSGKIVSSDTAHEKEISRLHEKIGQLSVERDFLAKISGKL